MIINSLIISEKTIETVSKEVKIHKFRIRIVAKLPSIDSKNDPESNPSYVSSLSFSIGNDDPFPISFRRRTNALSNLVAEQYRTSFQPLAFVGLNETWATYNRSSLPQRNSGRGFITAAQEPIQCFWYRAWAPGHPRQLGAPRCVTITRTRSWRTVNCLAQLPFVCEINTSGPDMRVNVRAQCSTRRENNRKFWEDKINEMNEWTVKFKSQIYC